MVRQANQRLAWLIQDEPAGVKWSPPARTVRSNPTFGRIGGSAAKSPVSYRMLADDKMADNLANEVVRASTDFDGREHGRCPARIRPGDAE